MMLFPLPQPNEWIFAHTPEGVWLGKSSACCTHVFIVDGWKKKCLPILHWRRAIEGVDFNV